MKYERFEDLPVWKTAIDLADSIFALTEDRGFITDGDLRDKLRRASLSVSNNIAEGFERGSTKELLMFLYISRGSAGEVRSMLHICDRWPRVSHLKSQISDLKSLAESCSKQIRDWANSLQNSDIAGQRHLNDQSLSAYQNKQRTDAFSKQIEQVVKDRVDEWSDQMRRSKDATGKVS